MAARPREEAALYPAAARLAVLRTAVSVSDMGLPELCTLVEAHVVDGEDRGVSGDDLRRDPQVWAEMVVEWGVLMAPVRSTPEAAQQDAERFRQAVVELGYEEQRGVDVGAHALLDSTEAAVGWRGGVNLTWFSFAVSRREHGTRSQSVPYMRADPTT